MQDLTISLIQTQVLWENRDGNLKHFEQLIEQLPKTDLAVLPEMFNTGFTMDAAKNAEVMTGPTVQWMKNQAERNSIHLAGSAIIEENGNYHNRFLLVSPNVEVVHYDKRHLFSMAGEDAVFSAGQEQVLWEIKGWKIRPNVCYDLRFPVWSRNTQNFDLMLFTANWPAKRVHHWKTLISARAIENQCYVAAVNRIGVDGAQFEYNGNSRMVDFDGNMLIEESDQDTILTATLNHQSLQDRRKQFPVADDADSFRLL